MRQKINFKNIIIFTLVFFSILMAPGVHAESEPHGAFYIEPHIPKNQKDANNGFYDLVMEPNMEQVLYLDIVNTGDIEMVATIEFENATTGLNAEKSFDNKKIDKSLTHPLTKYVELSDKEIELEPYATKTISIKVTAPDEMIDGVLLGGIIVTADKEMDKDKHVNDMDIKNRISYLVALQVSMNDNEVDTNLNYIKSDSELVDLNAQFVSYIQNDQPIVMNEVTVYGTITDVKGNVVASIEKDTGSIYPSSEFKVAYDLKDEKIKAGDYAVKLKITHEEDEWTWEDNITVDEAHAKDLNEKALTPKKTNVIAYFLLFIILLLLLLILVLYRKLKQGKVN